MDLDYDLPISEDTEDKFNREAIVSRICEIASSVSSDAAFVVGLSGAWGSGKTSILNMAAQKLEESNKMYVVRFNPWMISNQEQMVRVFFDELITGISKNNKKTEETANEVVRLLSEYYQALEPYCSSALTIAGSSVMPAPVAAAGSKLATTSLKRLLKQAAKKTNRVEKPLSELRKEISKLLAKQFANTVVLIDDMDRLDNEEIRQIFKLVNLTASFPRIVYVLAYDADVVDRALFEVQGIKGRDYLEKIVQVEMLVPEITKQDAMMQLSEAIEETLDAFELDEIKVEGERNRFLSIFDSIIVPVVSTPRRIARFLNLFRINVARSAGQICATDMVAMTIIQMFYPNTFQWIKANKEDICGSKYRFLGEKEVVDDLVEGLEAASKEDMISYAALLAAIQSIFPHTTRLLTGKSAYRVPSPEVAKARGRVSSIRLLDFFLTEQNSSNLTRAQLHRALSSESEEDIGKLVNEAIGQNEFNELLHFIQEDISSLPQAQIDSIARCLIRTFGKAKETEYALLIERESDELLGKTLRSLFESLGLDESSNIVCEAVSGFGWQNYVGMLFFLRDERLAQVEGKENLSCCITAQCYEALSHKYVKSIVQNAKGIIRSGDARSITMARAIAEDDQLSVWTTFEDLLANDTEMKVVYCADRLSRMHGGHGLSFSREWANIDVELPTVENVIRDEVFSALSVPALVRLAALYMLLQDPERDEIRETDAMALVKEWIGEIEDR